MNEIVHNLLDVISPKENRQSIIVALYQNEYLSPKEIAARLKLSKSCVLDILHRNQLSEIKFSFIRTWMRRLLLLSEKMLIDKGRYPLLHAKLTELTEADLKSMLEMALEDLGKKGYNTYEKLADLFNISSIKTMKGSLAKAGITLFERLGRPTDSRYLNVEDEQVLPFQENELKEMIALAKLYGEFLQESCNITWDSKTQTPLKDLFMILSKQGHIVSNQRLDISKIANLFGCPRRFVQKVLDSTIDERTLTSQEIRKMYRRGIVPGDQSKKKR